MSDMIDLFKEQNQKSKGDTLHRLPAKVVSTSTMKYDGVAQCDETGSSRYATIAFEMNDKKYKRDMTIRGDKVKKGDSVTVIYDKAKQTLFASSGGYTLPKVNNYSESSNKSTYNGKDIVVDNTQYARLEILGYEKLSIILPNKTGSTLSEGDDVWVHYWNDISAGYIYSNNLEFDHSTISDFIQKFETGVIKIKANGNTRHVDSDNILLKRIYKNPKIYVTLAVSNLSTLDTCYILCSVHSITNDQFEVILYSIDKDQHIPAETYTVYYLVVDI